MRNLLSLVCVAVVMAACGRAPVSQASGDYKLYEATTQHSNIAVIDSRTHAIERTLPLGTPSAGWTHLYSVSSDSLVDTDPATGRALHTLKLPGYYQLPPATLSGLPGGLSQNSRWLALESSHPTSAVPTTTHIVVVDTTYAKALRRIDLNGYFTFDAISNDGQRVYMIEYLSAGTYHVRMFDLLAGQLDPTVIFDKSDGSSAMAGLRLSGIPSPDGHWLYSVYVREHASPFIHALNLDGPIAFCIDLPGYGYATGNGEDALHWSIAMPAGGARLYAANGATGVASEVSLTGDTSPTLARSIQIETGKAVAGLFVQDVQAKEFGANATVITPDGKTMVTAASSGIVWIDTTGLHAGARALSNWTLWSLALSPDGSVLWALGDSGRIAEISMGSRQVTSTYDPGAGYPLSLMRVVAS
ncbi:MAG: hypothetical protein ABI334_09715 [Candidatus Dormiibacterota bacterium]